MSNIQVYQFHETGAIPGIPGEWHAGQIVEVDMDTMTVISVRLRQAPTQVQEEEEQTASVPPQSDPAQEEGVK